MKLTEKEKADRYDALVYALELAVDNMRDKSEHAMAHCGKESLNAFETYQYGVALTWREAADGIRRMIE